MINKNVLVTSFFAFCFIAWSDVLADTYHSIINLDLTRQRAIRLGNFEKSQLDRNIYFRSYHFPGMFSDLRAKELIEIGAIPGRGCGPFYGSPLGDSTRENYDSDTTIQNTNWAKMYQNAQLRYPNVEHCIAVGTFPESISFPNTKGWYCGVREDSYEQATEYIIEWLNTIKAYHGSVPIWLEPLNEPSWMWEGTHKGLKSYAEFTKVLAKGVAKAHPEVNICGPTPAWPYPGADWKKWTHNSWEREFIELAGDSVGAYSLHLYSKGHWALTAVAESATNNLLPPDPVLEKRIQKSPSLYETQRTGNVTNWEYGRIDGYLDLFAAYHMSIWGGQPNAMIISEYGRQSIYPQMGPWENDFKYWLYMTTVTRMWMTFMERPEVAFTTPFILAESDEGYAPKRGQAIFNRPKAMESELFKQFQNKLHLASGKEPVSDHDPTLVATPFRKFYSFFKELDGTRVIADVEDTFHSDSRHLTTRAFLKDNIAYLLIHNAKGYPQHNASFDISLSLGQDKTGLPVKITSKQIKRLRWEGDIPQPHDNPDPNGKLRIDSENQYTNLETLSSIKLLGEETCIIRLTLSANPTANTKVTETIYYSTETLVDIKENETIETSICINNWPGKKSYSVLYLGFAADGGFSQNPEIRINGILCDKFDLTYSQGISEFHALQGINIPTEIITEGKNIIEIRFKNKLRGKHHKLVTAKMSIGWENPVY